MRKLSMIIVTGAAGFIGSYMVGKLNQEGYTDIVLVDDFLRPNKVNNWKDKKYKETVQRNLFFDWLKITNPNLIQAVIHLGARTDTTDLNEKVFLELNYYFSVRLFEYCAEHQIPFLYASSAATYGDGKQGFSDLVYELKPLNPYAKSKHQFDLYLLKAVKRPYFWAGFKFFNVYGPNEYHKGRMASVVYHAYQQIQTNGKLKLFRSHRSDYKDGEQKRDFIYVKDVVEVLYYFLTERRNPDIYNLGTGKSRTFWDLGVAVFHALKKPVIIEFIDIPEDIRNSYQYFTEADMQKLKHAGYTKPFHSLEAGIHDYVENYLVTNQNF